jgi:Holliday junction resolvase RusA-like endonuclease
MHFPSVLADVAIAEAMSRPAVYDGYIERDTTARADPWVDVTVIVEHRPATYATGGERAWRAAVAAAWEDAGIVPQPRAWFAVSIDFRTPPPSRTGEAWDLDNLVKPTLDAMSLVFGARAWKGTPQPNDDRVVELHATKRQARPDETPGATIQVRIVDLPS